MHSQEDKKKAHNRKIDIPIIAQQALSRSADILSHWLPGGKFDGDEYTSLNPTRPDHAPGSFKINSKSGKWGDFAVGKIGGDLVSLVAYVDGIGQYEAAKKLAAFMGIDKIGVLGVPGVPKQPKPGNQRGPGNAGDARYAARRLMGVRRSSNFIRGR